MLTILMKCKLGELSVSNQFSNYFKFENSGPTSRNGIKLIPPKFRLFSTNNFSLYICDIFNSLPIDLRNSFNYSQFLKDLDNYYGLLQVNNSQ